VDLRSPQVSSGKEIDAPSKSHVQGCVVSEPTRGQVLKREADAPKDRNLFRIFATRPEAGDDFSQLSMNRIGT